MFPPRSRCILSRPRTPTRTHCYLCLAAASFCTPRRRHSLSSTILSWPPIWRIASCCTRARRPSAALPPRMSSRLIIYVFILFLIFCGRFGVRCYWFFFFFVSFCPFLLVCAVQGNACCQLRCHLVCRTHDNQYFWCFSI